MIDLFVTYAKIILFIVVWFAKIVQFLDLKGLVQLVITSILIIQYIDALIVWQLKPSNNVHYAPEIVIPL